MTAFALNQNPVTIPQCAALGESTPAGVSHAGMLLVESSITSSTPVEVFHVVLRKGLCRSTQVFDRVGYLDMTEAERETAGAWLEDLASRVPKVGYVCMPEYDETIRRGNTRIRLSCAGLVTSTYAYVDSRFVLVDLANAPAWTIHELSQIWPALGRADVGVLNALGLHAGNMVAGGFRVLLPGYIFHALLGHRPLVPTAAHASFP